jgi:hypothetical protein
MPWTPPPPWGAGDSSSIPKSERWREINTITGVYTVEDDQITREQFCYEGER